MASFYNNPGGGSGGPYNATGGGVGGTGFYNPTTTSGPTTTTSSTSTTTTGRSSMQSSQQGSMTYEQQQQQQQQPIYGNMQQWHQQPTGQQQQQQPQMMYGQAPMQQQQQQQQHQAPTPQIQPFWNPQASAAVSQAAAGLMTQAMTGSLSSDGVLDMASRLGTEAFKSGIPGLDGVMQTLRTYFAVDNRYVKRKMQKVLFPFVSKQWKRLVSYDIYLYIYVSPYSCTCTYTGKEQNLCGEI
jgi:hypothetical protein